MGFILFLGGDPTGVVCPPSMFKCPEGKCIPMLWVCNYQKDCEKGEDEFQSCRKYIYNKQKPISNKYSIFLISTNYNSNTGNS